MTSAADEEVLAPLRGLAIHCRPAAATTTFENRYVDGQRLQRCLAVARTLRPRDVPAPWRATARAVLLGPVLGEVEPALAGAFPYARVAVAAQGYLRQRLGDGTVVGRRWRPSRRWLARLAAVVLSAEDVAHAPGLLATLTAAPVLIVTRGAAGAELTSGGAPVAIRACSARAVDPTGAGDVFAAALLIALCEGRTPVGAARFAASAASWAVEAPGVAGIPTRRQVEERMGACDTSTR